jgi:Xaa-Pro aminopeptidase
MSISDATLGASTRTGITAGEYRERVDRVRDEAVSRGLDGIVAWSKGGGALDRYANVLYLTNHYSVFPDLPDQPPYWVGHSNVAAIITRDGESILVTDVPADPELVVADRILVEADVPGAVGAELDALGLRGRRVGLAGSDAITLERWQLLKAASPDVAWTVADDILARLRRVKSAAEQAIIRQAVAVGDRVVGALLDAAVAGATEAEVAASALHAAALAGASVLDLPASSGPYAGDFAHGTLPSWTGRELQAGDLYHSDAYGSLQGYFFDFGRTTVIGGDPSAEQERLIAGAIAAVDAAIDGLVPGSTFGDAYERAAGAITGAGLALGFPSFGHGIGLTFESPWITPRSPELINEGYALAVEAIVTLDGVGTAVHEHNLLIGPDGPEILSTTPERPWL